MGKSAKSKTKVFAKLQKKGIKIILSNELIDVP
jgi:hypothetical protein